MYTRRQSRRKSLPSDHIKDEKTERQRRQSSQCVSNCIVCPVCTVTVRGEDKFQQHYNQEIEKAKEPFSYMDAKKKQYQMKLRSQRQSNDNDMGDDGIETVETLEERTKRLHDIRKRRYERYTDMFVVSMKRKKASNCNNNQTIHSSTDNNNTNQDVTENSSTYELITCAVCNEFLETSNCKRHLSKCFAKHDYHFDLYSSSEDENEEENEPEVVPESWAYMDSEHYRREGQLTRLVVEDVDEDLDIDGDSDTQFGRQQFSERDVIPCSSEKSEEEIASEEILRQSVNIVFPAKPTCSKNIAGGLQADDANATRTTFSHCDKLKNIIATTNNDQNKLFEMLKRYMNKMEDKYEKEILKCPICMGPYNEPAVSISCWHTCCSDCWLRVLGTKKLCPKCNNIVSPSQLRKIFL